jgi:hypothetical protein
MAQHDMNIANQGFPAFRSDLNDALAALVSQSSGATAPATTFAHQVWIDTAADPSVLKIRNADNDALGEILLTFKINLLILQTMLLVRIKRPTATTNNEDCGLTFIEGESSATTRSYVVVRNRIVVWLLKERVVPSTQI